MAELDVVFGGQDNGLNGASMENRLQGNLRNDNNNARNENVYGNEHMSPSQQPQINSIPAPKENPETDAVIEKIQKQIEKQKKMNELKKELKSNNESIIDKFIKRKKDMVKLLSLSLIILLALSMNDIIKVYLNKYILGNELTQNKEFYTRVGVPLCVFLVLWTFKALF